MSRRDFMGGAAAAAMAFTIVPRQVLGGRRYRPPSEKLNIAGIGVGGMGKSNVGACKTENIVAMCGVDAAYAGGVCKDYPKARVFSDFRKMLDKQKNIDAVIIATPDHTHAVIAMAVMRRGIHVYVQKPLTRTVYEARVLTEAARKYKVATQMGNQGHSSEGARLTVEWIRAGVIGEVRRDRQGRSIASNRHGELVILDPSGHERERHQHGRDEHERDEHGQREHGQREHGRYDQHG